jgi:16S rRNA G1207 methylase RsmC
MKIDAKMMFSIKQFHERYETEATDIVVNDKKFVLLQPKYLYRFIDPHDVFHEFPLWAKIWRASWVLASHLANVPPDDGKQYLEIGGGLGLVSIVAASFGHRITMSEYNTDALNFAQANAHSNNCQDLPIIKLDWFRPQLEIRFDRIVASEVTYNEKHFEALIQLFKDHLKPGGEIILAWEIRKQRPDHFKMFRNVFDIAVSKISLRSEKDTHRIILMKMHFKD